jgi:hypothetical protein
MHNCKSTREHFTELLLDGGNTPPSELSSCKACNDEFEALKETLRAGKRVIEACAPEESYWHGYNARLKQRLLDSSHRHVQPVVDDSKSNWVRRFLGASISVPVPVAVAAVLVFGASLLLLPTRWSRQPLSTDTVSVVQVPVEVPVIKEKVVTQIVYKQFHRHSVAKSTLQRTDNPTLAKSQKPVSLIGFKPLDEVKLTVIKGGTPDEK